MVTTIKLSRSSRLSSCLALIVLPCLSCPVLPLVLYHSTVSHCTTHSSTPILGFSHGLKAPHSLVSCDNKLPCLVLFCLSRLALLVLSCFISTCLACLVLSCFVCLDLPRLVFSCLALSVSTCLVLSCFVCLDLPCLVSVLYLTGLKAPNN